MFAFGKKTGSNEMITNALPTSPPSPFDFGCKPEEPVKKRGLQWKIFASAMAGSIVIGCIAYCLIGWLSARCGEATDGTYVNMYVDAVKESLIDDTMNVKTALAEDSETFAESLRNSINVKLNYKNSVQSTSNCPLQEPFEFSFVGYGQNEHEYYICGSRYNGILTTYVFTPGKDKKVSLEWFDSAGFNGLTAGTYVCSKHSDDSIVTIKATVNKNQTVMATYGSFFDEDDDKYVSSVKNKIMTIECGFELPWMHNADKAASTLVKKSDSYEHTADINGKQATAELMDSLDNYSVVILFGNGYTLRPYGTCFQIGEKALNDAAFDTQSQLVDIGGKCFMTGRFITDRFPDHAFDNSLFFMGQSNPETNFSIPAALVSKGASCVFAFNGTVSNNYAHKMCTAVFESLSDGRTAAEALSDAKDKCGAVDPDNKSTELVIIGNEQYRLEGFSAGK